jgi:CHASE2 domain-containing sensor protein
MVIVLQKSKNRKFNKTLAAILIIYTIALICSVCMLVIMTNTRYIFAVIALVGYVVVSVLIIIKLIQFFINKKRKR